MLCTLPVSRTQRFSRRLNMKTFVSRFSHSVNDTAQLLTWEQIHWTLGLQNLLKKIFSNVRAGTSQTLRYKTTLSSSMESIARSANKFSTFTCFEWEIRSLRGQDGVLRMISCVTESALIVAVFLVKWWRQGLKKLLNKFGNQFAGIRREKMMA